MLNYKEKKRMKYYFIKTTDTETKDSLLRAGFKIISQDGGVYTFLNDSSLKFSDEKKINYSNQLCI